MHFLSGIAHHFHNYLHLHLLAWSHAPCVHTAYNEASCYLYNISVINIKLDV
jgi:uncharacterized phage-associated protein